MNLIATIVISLITTLVVIGLMYLYLMSKIGASGMGG